jgi:integrase/recombinase XerD
MANIRKPVNRRIIKRKKFLDEDCLKHILFYSKNYIDIEKKTRNYAVIRLFITTGMRKTALTSINIEDLDFRNRELHVIDKRDKELVYYLDNEMIKALKEWISVRETIKGNDNALFLSLYGNGRGKRMSKDSVDILVKNVCKNAGYHDVTPHQLRASFCSIMYEKTKDIEFVRRSVGHADVATTMRYITTNNDERQKSVNIMSNILEG